MSKAVLGRKDSGIEVEHADAGPGFFRTLGAPLLTGRNFAAADRSHSSPLVIGNQARARAYFSGQDPIGQRL